MNVKIKSGGSGSSEHLANYLEHEDLNRAVENKEIECFFNKEEDRVPKKEVVRDIDNNKARLSKSETKHFHLILSPSKSEIKAMGNTPQEQSANFKKHIRQDVMQKYAEGFNKGLESSDIKFYGKIHFDRKKSDNELNMHCHIIISRKDQSNKMKISPQTNHTGDKKTGTAKGGFNRNEFYTNVEKDFDKRFDYKRSKEETFEYCNTMKKGKILEIEKMAEKNVRQELDKKLDKSQGKELDKMLHRELNKSKGKGLGL
ncbi:DUF5712 family protein [Dysgonomonas sp. ZJ279]|uniref:DUF5712 family protein n=1 Tax=Dysgonomonas sp. ZJ279 TaxID=2709796 RepID=UPI0013EC87F7|nr:DUF5712 family protein [Dysgonomonas sp. ZJ279]